MDTRRPVVVIVGAGFAGIHAAKALRDGPVQVVMVDKNNYHLFQPLLYQVATAALDPGEIAYPVRTIFRRQKNFRFQLGEARQIDFNRQILETSTGALPYDYLILAAGGESHYFGMDSVAQNGFDMKDLGDAMAIRNHILRMFERASQESDPVRSRALRTFVVAGGGPTGVECAGALSELVRLALAKDYPEVNSQELRVILLEASGHLLTGFPEELALAAQMTLERKKVEVRLNTAVSGYDGSQVVLKDGELISASTLIWAAGVRAASLLDRSGLPQARQGRVPVLPTLQVPGHPEIYVVGDAAYLEDGGQPLPMMAPVAIQQGKTAARNILHHAAGEPLVGFEYHDPGSLATIGRNEAVARVKGFQFHGFPAWVVWLGVHLLGLIGFRNRLLVMINWAWDYFFYERVARLITPEGGGEAPGQAVPIDLPVLGKIVERKVQG